MRTSTPAIQHTERVLEMVYSVILNFTYSVREIIQELRFYYMNLTIIFSKLPVYSLKRIICILIN